MRATLSRQKGNIAHKDILLHAHAILSREEKLATP
ncbi:putative DNA-binding protein with PD1-like motif [Rhizobium aethiopicum]|uniref:Putative DNA-binding protein with PD1-like motif n=1 Tax=Rhizobium aethiopicum TaxID=1138170 RepID=A0A7W6QCX6_9HYPH|nr:putative DNA-binding protein with PD1-like motif [Rhizobium aethiopicum]MBB4582771.1 putative DNA-binding protein with PD1-like motif [Rhizobium aethiopicum]